MQGTFVYCKIDADAIKTCRIATLDFAHCIDYTIGYSVLFLKNFSSQIDFLYLDLMDCPEQDIEISLALLGSQQHQLMEIQAAFDKLSEDSVVVLDDNDFENGGKTKLSKLFLEEMGWTEKIRWKQSLWMKE